MNRKFILAVLVAASAFAAGPAPAQTGKTALLTNERLITLLQNGASETTILSLIERFPDSLDSGPDALVRLREAGASNEVLLAVRRKALTQTPAAQEPGSDEEAAEPAGDGGDRDTPGLVQKNAYGVSKKPGLFENGDLSLGLGYPFLGLKYDFSDYALEGRFLSRNGIQVYSGRGYWDFYERNKWTAYTGLEAGYVRYGSGRYAGHAYELSPFLGGAYAIDRNFSVSADISPALVFLPGGGSDFDIGDLGWYINIGVFFRLPSMAPKSPLAADASNTAAMDTKNSDSEISAWRRAPAAKRKASYEDRLASADRYVSQKDYPEAAEEYSAALASLKESDARRIFLFERRAWLALKENNVEGARDLYLAAISAAKQLGVYDANTVNAYCGLAYCFEKLENIPLAVRNYERAMDITASAGVRSAIEKTLRRLRASAPQE
ncbi:MAG: hypothetical protein A2179_06740 [Elusimicrobia bacterium GWC2_63_65]|nr:MAG: hypothetical protein A2179_06740 [Elusimicrobia bacterium GWC2_63_65]